MITNIPAPSSEDLDAFSRRLGVRTREFNNGGEFSTARDAYLEQRRKRHAALEAKLESAIRRGAVWASIRLELERDFDTLCDNFGYQLN